MQVWEASFVAMAHPMMTANKCIVQLIRLVDSSLFIQESYSFHQSGWLLSLRCSLGASSNNSFSCFLVSCADP
jgi:hypothetical protein